MAAGKVNLELKDITLTKIVADGEVNRAEEDDRIKNSGDESEGEYKLRGPLLHGVYLVSGSICECRIIVPEVLRVNEPFSLEHNAESAGENPRADLMRGQVTIEGRCTKTLTLTAASHQVEMISADGNQIRKADIIFPGITFPAMAAGKRGQVTGEIFAVWRDKVPKSGKWRGNISYDMVVEAKG